MAQALSTEIKKLDGILTICLRDHVGKLALPLLSLAGAARYGQFTTPSPSKHDGTGPVDCSALEYVNGGIRREAQEEHGSTDCWVSETINDDCEKHFTYFPELDRYVVLQKVNIRQKCIVKSRTNIYGGHPDDVQPRVCEHFPSNFAEKVKKEVEEKCKATLCELAKRGQRRGKFGGHQVNANYIRGESQ